MADSETSSRKARLEANDERLPAKKRGGESLAERSR